MVSSRAATVAEYLTELPADRRADIATLRERVSLAMPNGFVEEMRFGMIGWVVPLDLFSKTRDGQPLVYTALAAQKNYNALYLTCLAASADRTERLRAASAASGKRLDMGKSCIRFRRMDDLAIEAIMSEIASTTPQQFIAACEAVRSA